LLFDLYAHVSSCFFYQVLVFVREQQDRLFRVVDEICGEIWLIVQDQRDVVSSRNIFRGDNRELIPREIALESDLLDRSACGGASHRCAVKHVRKRKIIDVERGAGNFLPALFPGKRFSDGMIHYGFVITNGFASSSLR
jgi:hypothetical protein